MLAIVSLRASVARSKFSCSARAKVERARRSSVSYLFSIFCFFLVSSMFLSVTPGKICSPIRDATRTVSTFVHLQRSLSLSAYPVENVVTKASRHARRPGLPSHMHTLTRNHRPAQRTARRGPLLPPPTRRLVFPVMSALPLSVQNALTVASFCKAGRFGPTPATLANGNGGAHVADPFPTSLVLFTCPTSPAFLFVLWRPTFDRLLTPVPTEFQLLHTPDAFMNERIAWRLVIYLNLVRSVRRSVLKFDCCLLSALKLSCVESWTRSRQKTRMQGRNQTL